MSFLACLPHIDSALLDSTAAILGGLAVQTNHAPENELWSEVLCWIFVAALIEASRRLRTTTSALNVQGGGVIVPQWASWAIAGSIATACFCRTAVDVRWIYPLLTPLLLVFRQYLEPEALPTSQRSQSSIIWSYLSSNVAGALAVALIGVASLFPTPHVQAIAFAVVALSAQFGIFAGLSKYYADDRDESSGSHAGALVLSIAWRAVLILLAGLGLQFFAVEMASLDIKSIFLAGAFKGLHWFFLFRLTQRVSWDIATTIGTFAIAGVLEQDGSILQIFGQAVTALLALSQSIFILPKSTPYRYLLWSFAAIPLFLLSQTAYAQGHYLETLRDHPVEQLIREAEARFQATLVRQSTTYDQAVAEYKHRNHREPPPGFQGWFDYAQAHGAMLIDEYSTIDSRIAPFLKMSGELYYKTLRDAGNAPMNDLLQCNIENGNVSGGCRHLGEGIMKYLEDVKDAIPDVALIVNRLDEPSVVSRPHAPTPAQLDGSEQVAWQNGGRQTTWGHITSGCPSPKPSALSRRSEIDTAGLPFVKNLTEALDLCLHPEYAKMHGFWQSPTSFRWTKQAVPLLSEAAPSTFGDILYPSTVYGNENFRYNPADDVEWDAKRPALYWAGSTTGAHSNRDGWQDYHRQRFVRLGQDLDQGSYSYLERVGTRWQRTKPGPLDPSQYEVAFTAVIQCDPKQCQDQKDFFKPKERAGAQEIFNYQLNFDLDGNGMSGRFERFVASNSLPLKQTVFEEWHTNRLVPWLHYVPVSLGMEELPELVRYLSSTPEGQASAKKLARQGSDWAAKALRPVDKTIFMYRLLLEMGRLQDSKRRAE